MANTLITPTMLTREALRILHQKLRFIGTIDRQYDKRFAQSGAKIGSTLQVREPNQFAVRTGKTLDVQDVSESYKTIEVATQKGVDFQFDSEDLTMDIDNFGERYLEPAMSVLAATMEADALSMYKDVHNEISDVGATITFADVLNARKAMVDNLTPSGKWCVQLNTEDNVALVDVLKGLYNDQSAISKQYREGLVGRTAGFDFYENTLLPVHTTGSDDGTGDANVNGSTEDGSAITIEHTGTSGFKKGDVIHIAGLYRVHPETKVSTGKLMRFVVTADAAGDATTLNISPPIVVSGPKQNVSGYPANDADIFKVESDYSTAIGNAADYSISLAYHKEAFTFVTADLVMPKGVDFAARQVMDGISMRVVRQYDINNDNFPVRIDVFYGYKTLRPEFACRLGFN